MSSEFSRRFLYRGRNPLVLASSSPRRRSLLELIGIPADVVPPSVEEVTQEGEPPEGEAVRLAKEKADEVAARFPERLVVAADTVVHVGGEILGKPIDRDDARSMLRRLSGRSHAVVTGVAVRRGDREASGFERTEVTFRTLPEEEIVAYVATGESDDKAGSYGAQGLGCAFIVGVRGCFYNVVGLPIVRLVTLIGEVEREG